MYFSIISLPAKIFRFAILAAQSKYPRFSDKLDIYFTLLSLFTKACLFPRKTTAVSQRTFGYTVFGYDYPTLFSLYREIFVRQLYKVELSTNKPNILDCGANIGMAVLYFKKKYPDACIKAFEPNPHVFEILRKNIEVNQLKDTEAFNVALSDRNGTIDFFLGNELGSQMGSIHSSRAGSNKMTVDCRKLSDYMTADRYGIVKIDVEGAETEILADIRNHPAFLHCEYFLIEYHHKIGQIPSRLSHFLLPFETAGYEYNVIQNYFQKMGSFQDLILAFYKPAQ